LGLHLHKERILIGIIEMNQDVIADWKTNRFIIADSVLHEDLGHLLILTDYNFWGTEETSDKLLAWCSRNKCKMQGMTLILPTDKLLTMFILEWSK
jgi:hypothetical protein